MQLELASPNLTYESLWDAGNQIRLLIIDWSRQGAAWAGEYVDGEIWTMSIHDFDEAPPFAAVSYTWGAEHPRKAVLVNKNRLERRENCWYALRQVFDQIKTEGTSYLWIDSICINQSDLGEKTAQVRKMSAIFSKAEIVFACVGYEADDSGFLLQWEGNFEPGFLGKPTWFAGPERRDKTHEVPRLSIAYIKFCARPYWKRLWVVPEIIAARKIQVICGPDRAQWEHLSNLARSIPNSGDWGLNC